ncbi:MAG: hypothetical protein U9N06_06560 [candidate division WOR-3 bacterium]|nr:hypothetical protein [candidate division WOR-3 bacterium]
MRKKRPEILNPVRKISEFIFSLLSKFSAKQIKFPLEGIKNVTIRPSTYNHEILYSLPIVKKLSEEFNLTALLPKNRETDYFERFPVKIIKYPENLNFINTYCLKNRLKNESVDLFIDLNRRNIDMFSFLLKNPVTTSIHKAESVNLQVNARTASITDNYQYLMDLLGFPISWDSKVIGLPEWEGKTNVIGISSDLEVDDQFLQVKTPKDLYRVSSLITKKNDLSTIAFFLGVSQILLMEEKDPFHPPKSIKVIRYSKSITSEVIKRCLNSL